MFDHRPGGTSPRDTSEETLLSLAFAQFSALFRKEIDLARTELSQNMRAAFLGLGLIIAAIVLGLTGLNSLSAALVTLLIAQGWEPALASAAIGGAILLLALIFLWRGLARLKSSSLAPERSVKNIRKDTDIIKEAF
ncbi:MAG: phage holin family protein [Mangrovicoccus sp.]